MQLFRIILNNDSSKNNHLNLVEYSKIGVYLLNNNSEIPMEITEIKKTRVGGLGSSDAKLVANCGITGILSEPMRVRIAVMLGLIESPEFSTPATEKGKRIENEVFELLKEKYTVESNPYHENLELSEMYGFKVFNHIDFVISRCDASKTYIEHKSTCKNIEHTMNEYIEQLAWHCMVLDVDGQKSHMVLSHYLTNLEDDNEYFDVNKFTTRSVCRHVVETHIANIKKGLHLIFDAIKAGFDYENPESLPVEMLPSQIQTEIDIVGKFLEEIRINEAKIDLFKSKMLDLMEKSGVKSIKSDLFTITRVAESTSMRFDSKAFTKDMPELAAKFSKTVKKKSFITINLK